MTSAGAGESTVGGAVHRAKRSAWLTRLALLVVAGVVTVIVVRLIGRIDWAAVYDALRHLTWWQPFVLLAVVVVRQVLNALPLALYIPRVSALRATVNDLGAILMSAVAPPPSDLALRVGMFNSWGVPTVHSPAPASPRSVAPSIGPGGRHGSGGWSCWRWPGWSPSSSCGSSAASTGRRSTTPSGT